MPARAKPYKERKMRKRCNFDIDNFGLMTKNLATALLILNKKKK